MSTIAVQPKIKFKSIVLPASHGGWGFLLEPILLGLWVAPSVAGLWLAVAACAAFLVQQPLKLALGDRRRRRRYPRTIWAERFVLFFSAAILVALGLAISASQAPFWLPLMLAAPLALIQLYYDTQNRGRYLIAELSGAVALGAVAPAIAQAAGWSLALGMTLWLILVARTLASVVYVRARLRLERGQPVVTGPVWLAHVVGIALVAGLAWLELAPWLSVLALLLLLVRAVYGLSAYRRPVQPRTVGFQEMGYGLGLIILTAVGYSWP
jgi:hypothetical protein